MLLSAARLASRHIELAPTGRPFFWPGNTKIARFMAKLRTETSAAAACLQFIALTCARLSEAIGATWDEVDLANKVWVVPANRMKGGKEHRVPLSDAALAVLKEMQAIRRSDYGCLQSSLSLFAVIR